MKYFLIIVAGTLLVTYAWGWSLHVPDKEMTPKEYTEHYYLETRDLGLYFFDEAKKLVRFSKKDIVRPKDAEMS
jgi:hypothetical protein